MYYVDTDNAMGSNFGDVDDAFALAALILARKQLLGIGAVKGNTSEKASYENTKRLVQLCNIEIPVLSAESLETFIMTIDRPFKILALGPLNNIPNLIQTKRSLVKEIVLVGSNSESKGRFPPLWPYEFNLVKTRGATISVFESGIPLTIIPLNVAKRFQVSLAQVAELPGHIGKYLFENSKRWFFRSLLLKAKKTVPLWDLVAALYVIEPTLFTSECVPASIHKNAYIEYGKGERSVTLIQDFDSALLWDKFEELFTPQS